MSWTLKWAKEIESGYYENLLARGFVKPEDLEPDVSKFQFYFDAFRELSTCRSAGMEAGPIPFTAIHQYFTLYESPGTFEEFLYLIRVMDNCVLTAWAKERAAQKK